ncbi:MAG TPA: PBP1A family penicillin-binding protein [Candidatus Ruminococcus avistercoris]|nr:PBP1A family penicillin-binding protein [Candidatus Ruminococcus avistercoris]
MHFGKQKTQNRLKNKKKRRGMLVFKVILLFLLLAVAVTGVGAAVVYNRIISEAPQVSAIDITPAGNVTFIYDDEGEQIQQLNSAEGNRISVSIEEIPTDMQHAIVAIEDARFYEHNGVDYRGMLRAVVNAVTSGFRRMEGASTITQQLLKNNVFTDWMSESTWDSIKRKIQEQYLAVELEAYLTEQGEDAKSVILENYLNTVNFGSGAYGIQMASQTYFGKDCKDLTLSECAVLAAIPQNPTRWNPRTNPEENAKRREVVLRYMTEQGWITAEEQQEALADDVYSRIQETAVVDEDEPYSYFVDGLIQQVEEHLIQRCGYTEEEAEKAVYSGGLRIYSTQDSDIQAIMDEEFQKEENYPDDVQYELEWALTVEHADGTQENYSREMLRSYFRESDASFDLLFASQDEAQSFVDQYKAAVLTPEDTIVAERVDFTPQPQAAMTVIEQSTGQVKGIVGGRGEKTASLTLNRATDATRQPGSTFKILSTYGPALEEEEITLATMIEDEPYEYADGTPLSNADDAYHGTVSVRTAITYSYNIPAVKVLTDLTPQTGYDYLTRLGFTTLDAQSDTYQPLALGGITNGVTNLELTAAYAAIANEGNYIEPSFYTRVTDKEGNVLLENTSEETRVFSESTAFLLTSAMESVMEEGTGTALQLEDMTAAGKTGTTTSYVDLVFAGYTPYYTSAVWAGYDTNMEVPEEGRTFHQTLWTRVMNRIHENLPDQEFSQPDDVEEVTICADSGLLPGFGCTRTTEYFSSATVPTERCKEHGLFSRPTKEPEDNREEEDEWDDQEEEPVEPEESEEEEQEEEQEDPWWWGWWN